MMKVLSAVSLSAKAIIYKTVEIYLIMLTTISVRDLRSLILSVLKLIAIVIHYIKLYVIMSKLIWKLYNENMISMEVADMLLDEHYNRVNKKRY